MSKLTTIDLTPTWEAVSLIYLAALEDGTPEGKHMARAEIIQMAKNLDLQNARLSKMQKQKLALTKALQNLLEDAVALGVDTEDSGLTGSAIEARAALRDAGVQA